MADTFFVYVTFCSGNRPCFRLLKYDLGSSLVLIIYVHITNLFMVFVYIYDTILCSLIPIVNYTLKEKVYEMDKSRFETGVQ